MSKLTLGFSPEKIVNEIKIVREGIEDDESYQKADAGILLSNLDDIISMCDFALKCGYHPVKRGHWVFGSTYGHSWMKCSECLHSENVQTGCWTYCPRCGAYMIEE